MSTPRTRYLLAAAVSITTVLFLLLGMFSFVVGASAPILVYIVSQLTLHGHRGWRNLRSLPILAAIGTGIAISNGTAVWQAVRGKQSAFVRTPKAGSSGTSSYRARAHSGIPEAICALWAIVGMTVGFIGAHTWITPLLAVYLSGFAWMSYHCIRQRRARIKPVQAGPAAQVVEETGGQPA